ncbi:MAG: tRNA (N(6)-L-threonylcarbamoyladenosine(37)-C(2))-methylthiotransferase MtaB [Candidatus Loosdrechtia sp.]|uniref:MiaB/RimO family radical SAM methylthiotransferase n=1 Tax=Candidatus Loosdrechtia sp. TaxID=3101272 RepID=UPI003A5F18C6|nr:MAG: tRNA (N(6)-L-threonylcarbamoyladenosine(37)-C(2))-methylthiotransferase MtaB [Candidatus Jettenia sp. AMX2]
MRTCAFITLGCKVNQYETQAIRESLAAKGLVETSPEDSADIYVINTCTVTSLSEEKSRQYIKKVRRKNPEAKVVVTGCYAEADTEILKRTEGVDYVITKAEESQLAEIIKDFHDSNSAGKLAEDSIYNLKISHFAGHTRAFLKIEDGCDMYCSYCIIPYVRGGIKSRKPKEIKEEAERLIRNGYKEVILTGIHLGAYGRDTEGRCRLADVILMLNDLPGLERIRLSSIDVNDITGDVIDLVSRSKKICPHFHIPLQSGDDFILKRMNRKYTASHYLEIINTIKSKIELPSFTTDIMVGFPGEKDIHFQNTLQVCEKAGFSRIHIFPFSVRKGTPAAKMPDHCHPQTIKDRKAKISNIANNLSLAYKKQFLQKQAEVLVETERDPTTNKLCGYSERYLKVFFDGPDTIKNTIVPVRIQEVTPLLVTGDI